VRSVSIWHFNLQYLKDHAKAKAAGWLDQIFLKPWATPELLNHDPRVGEMVPPLRPE